MKIVVSEGLRLLPEQIKRIESFGGEVKIYKDATKSKEESMIRYENADIICAESGPIEGIMYELKNKLISFPFVGMGWLEKEKLRENNIKVSNAPGCNKTAVSEWIVSMMILLSKELYPTINHSAKTYAGFPVETRGMATKNVTILGKGNVGRLVGRICEAMGMKVKFFMKNDNLEESVKGADYIINCLARNKETEGMLDDRFFNNMKEGVYFISATSLQIYDIDALKEGLDEGRLAGVAIDLEGISPGDNSDPLYKDLIKHPKVLTTPHIAFNTDVAMKIGNDIMIDNAEAWVGGKQMNVVI